VPGSGTPSFIPIKEGENMSRLFVGNLSFDVTEEQLQAAFAPFGASGATIPTRWSRSASKQDRPKGFGYVDVPPAQKEAAIKGMQGHVLNGRSLDVREAIPKPELRRFDEGGFSQYSRSYGRGGGGGGGFRGRR
jgi:RNA recognition motif-containing protein